MFCLRDKLSGFGFKRLEIKAPNCWKQSQMIHSMFVSVGKAFTLSSLALQMGLTSCRGSSECPATP